MDLLETAATEAESLAIPEPQDATFATIGEVHDDGVTLIFDGQTTATEKHYKVNTSVVFNKNDRVKIIKDSGTYVVEYVVGAPSKAGSSSGLQTNEFGVIEAPALKVANKRLASTNDRTQDIYFSYKDNKLLFSTNGNTFSQIYPAV